MPRILWFAMGVLAGTAYSSSLIHKERLDQSPADAALDVDSPEAKALADAKAADTRASKEKIAERIEEGAIRVSGFIEEKAHMIADRLRGITPPSIDEPAQAQTPPAMSSMQVQSGPSMAAPASMAAPSMAAPIHVDQTRVETPTPSMMAGGGGGSTAHEVLETPFPQVDPSRPSEPILQNPDGKPPVMLDVTSDQGGMEHLR